MGRHNQTDGSIVNVRRALAGAGALYVLIAFEFLYMASPFAAYFYGVYGLGLDWLQGFQTTRWLIRFFMPHLVEETTSFAIDAHEFVGGVLFLGGLAGFAAGAVQVYSAKLRRRGAVTGGLYRHIRHPQYLGLIVASIGMLLLWPRYLVVVATVTVIFVYIALARAEETVCVRRFPGYAGYLKRTGMFVPGWFNPKFRLLGGHGAVIRAVGWVLAYAVALTASLLLAIGVSSPRHRIASCPHGPGRSLALGCRGSKSRTCESGDDCAFGTRSSGGVVGQEPPDRLRSADADVHFGDPDASAARGSVWAPSPGRTRPRPLQGRVHPSGFRRP